MSKDSILQARELAWAPAGKTNIIQDIWLGLRQGEILGIVGPNGAGKTTLLRALYRVLRPSHGEVLFHGKDIWQLKPRQFAAEVAVLTQESAGDFSLRVRDVVATGCIPLLKPLQGLGREQQQLIDRVLHGFDLQHLAEAPFSTLSGGERQRTLFARALVREPSLLILDEPSNHLDIHYQLDLMERVRVLRVSSIMSLHDLNLAARYCDRIAILANGRLVAEGTPDEVFAPPSLQAVFNVEVETGRDPRHQRPWLAFYPPRLQL